MSWNLIAAALAARVLNAAGAGVANSWPYLRFSKTPPNSAAWEAIFCDGSKRINCWQVTRDKRTSEPLKGENSWYIIHQVKLIGMLGLWDPAATDIVFEPMVEAICEDLRTGDRTLGGKCQSYAEPIATTGLGTMNELVDKFHLAQIQFEIVEEVAGPVIIPSEVEYPPNGPDYQGQIAQAIIAYTNANLTNQTGLTLVTHEIDTSTEPHPRYPANPTGALNKLVLRPYTGDLKPRPNEAGDWFIRMSYWYYRLQGEGDVNGQLVLADITQIESIFASGNVTPVIEAGASYIAPLKTVIHNELNHRTKNPALRVSVAEMLFDIQISFK